MVDCIITLGFPFLSTNFNFGKLPNSSLPSDIHLIYAYFEVNFIRDTVEGERDEEAYKVPNDSMRL